MKLENIQKIAVLGAGIMGHGIAQRFLMARYPVHLYDIDEAILKTARTHIEQNLRRFQQFGLIAEADIAPAMARLSTGSDLAESVQGSDFILEAAPEDLRLKQRLFEAVEASCSEDAILSSNTSSLTIEAIGSGVKHKKRLITTHWFNPPHIVPTVEVVKSPWTSEETLETTYALMERIGKTPVRINRELPGFLINRIQMAMIREILDLYDKGIASASDIDKAVKGSIGFRLASIGPLLTIDLAGTRLWLKVCENLFPEIADAKEPPPALKDLAAKGHDGIKSGKGFYDYTHDFSQSELDEAIGKRDREFLDRLRRLYEPSV
ncbi:MAG: 3-hydroxyacyl-CoA dehydrogenase family protein [Deltaproteobacteria bacterium]|nr:3-hydroxyacyl-CoA dehydrogenase family protein [Deltaproteobacteria bacterium]